MSYTRVGRYSYARYVPMDETRKPTETDPVMLAAGVKAAMEGWTQVALSEATGIPQGRISAIVNNYRDEKPTLNEMTRIEDAVGLPRGYILGFAGVVTAEGAQRGVEAAAAYARAASPKSDAPKRSRRA